MLITGTIQKQAWVDRVTPPVEQVRENVWSIPIDFGITPVRYTFCYVVLNGAGQCVVIDPGWDSELGRKQFLDGVAAAGASVDSIVGIVSTHLHADHLGMVEWVVEQTGAWVAMHPVEANALAIFEHSERAVAADQSWLEQLGVPEEHLQRILADERTVDYMQALAKPTLLVNDGDYLPLEGRKLLVVATPGHTPGHICIVDEDNKVIFTGDHILPRITPNVGITTAAGEYHALADYYRSLDRVKKWSEHEVLPAHEYRFQGLAERAEVLAVHHRDRSQEIVNVARATPGSTVWEVASRISWSRGWESLDGINLRSALAETMSHVDNLIETRKIEAHGEHPIRLELHH